MAENQPKAEKQNRVTDNLSNFAARLRGHFLSEGRVTRTPKSELRNDTAFNKLSLELFALQFAHNASYRHICESRMVSPKTVEHWTQIPAVPTSAFKDFELSCLPPDQRTQVFHSSGTTEQRPSRHFHNAESLVIYEASLLPWFSKHVLPASQFPVFNLGFALLTPPPAQVPHSSLVHMFGTVRREFGAPASAFVGQPDDAGTWALNFDTTLAGLRGAIESKYPLLLLGTAFSFVHLLDFLAEQNLRFRLPAGSRVMETGGYKGRSRVVPKAELHTLITQKLGIPQSHIICEYGMSELSSQAYDFQIGISSPPSRAPRHFHFPPWVRVQIISPETNREVAEGETGLIRIFDLANVFSVLAIQTEDLGSRRDDGFELIGRAELAEPRGCSLMVQT